MTVTVCIPFEDRDELTRPLVAKLLADGGFDRLLLVDNGSTAPRTRRWTSTLRDPRIELVRWPKVGPGHSLYRSWNLATSTSDVAVILNNDITIPDRFVPTLVDELVRAPADIAAVYPRSPRSPRPPGPLTRTRGMWPSGFAPFAFAGRDLPTIDESFILYCGDVELVRLIEQQGRTCARVESLTVGHQLGGTRKRNRHRWKPIIAADRALMATKYPEVPHG